MENAPSRMFMALRECGALARILPEIDRLFGVPQPPAHHPEIDTGLHVMLVLDVAAKRGHGLAVRFAALMHDLGKGTTPEDLLPRHHGHEERGGELVKILCKRIKVPNDCRDLAIIAARFHGKAHRAEELRPDTVMRLLQDTDAFRQPERFEDFLLTCECDARGRTGFEFIDYPQAERLRGALKAAQAVDAGAVAGQQSSPDAIREAVYQARLRAVELALLIQP